MARRNLILLLPVAFAAIATLLFAAQGGFGGGHDKFDFVIWILGLPGTLGTTLLPMWPGDFLALVALPAAINVVVWFSAVSFIRNRVKARRT